MLIPHLFLPSATLIFTFLKCLHPASSQTAPQFNPSPSPAATSSLPTASSPTDTSSYNFTYPIFPDHDNSGISVSYKDTIDVSWISNGVEHVPVLQIQCWNRNDSSSFIYYQTPPSYSHNLSTSPGPTYPLPLGSYRKYSPCQLRLLDPDQTDFTDGSETVTSVAFFISQDTNASTLGVTWSMDNEAPKVAVDAGVATTESGSARTDPLGTVISMWVFVGAVAATTMLL